MNICATCKHWARELNSEGRADCRRLEEDGDEWFEKALMLGWPECGHDGPALTYETRPEFGCALWTEDDPPRDWKEETRD